MTVTMPKAKESVIKFPYPTFPFRIEHKDGNDKKICWFQTEGHANKYLERSKLKANEYKLESNGVEIVGKGTRRKSNKK